MKHHIFFSISQTPVGGVLPPENEMWNNFFSQVIEADKLGFESAWIAEAHLSSEVQKQNKNPVIPHWQGEVGLNTDIFQLAREVFARTERIEVGSAILNLLCNGGPVAHAERLATFLSLHGLNPNEKRKLNLGFAAGRFDFNSRATGVVPRNGLEESFWPIYKNKFFEEATEVFLRLFQGETLSSQDIPQRVITKDDFLSEGDWQSFRISNPLISETHQVERR